MKYAPVLIPTLNRYEHFKRCVESLSNCFHANETTLFIALDYPLKESHWEGYRRILEYIDTINSFKNVEIIKRKENFGPYKNLLDSIDSVFKDYDRLIFSEDDNYFAPKFLDFVNEGLKVYESRKEIFSFSGYNSPIKMPFFYQHDVYIRRAFTAWGVGLWREKWNEVDWTMKKFNQCMDDPIFHRKLQKQAKSALAQLVKMRKSGLPLGDGVILVHLLKNDMYSVYPVKSKVRNTGHDGSGVHCKGGKPGSLKYLHQQIDEGTSKDILPHDLQINKRLLKYVNKQTQPSIPDNLKTKIPAPIKKLIKAMFSFNLV